MEIQDELDKLRSDKSCRRRRNRDKTVGIWRPTTAQSNMMHLVNSSTQSTQRYQFEKVSSFGYLGSMIEWTGKWTDQAYGRSTALLKSRKIKKTPN